MISDAEFVAIKNFDRTLDRAVGEANVMIAGKNAELSAACRIIARLKREAAAAEARAVAAEARVADLVRQIQLSLN